MNWDVILFWAGLVLFCLGGCTLLGRRLASRVPPMTEEDWNALMQPNLDQGLDEHPPLPEDWHDWGPST
jgi:hypothetical protein